MGTGSSAHASVFVEGCDELVTMATAHVDVKAAHNPGQAVGIAQYAGFTLGGDASPRVPTRPGKAVARTALACVFRAELDQRVLAYKLFLAKARSSWAREVASHLVLPRNDVAGLQAFGIDSHNRPWLMTQWCDWRNLRSILREGGGNAPREHAGQLLGRISESLRHVGYLWADPATRNLLVSDLSMSRYCMVDYALRPLGNSPDFDACLAGLLATAADTSFWKNDSDSI
ncbi:hypothetical protein FBQ98_12715 [Gammaproteobacteria bacterium PRO6]|nr:hypothetical protein [Gammaproteobacteria bacterium PRO6]